MTREDWLGQIVNRMYAVFAVRGMTIPEEVRISCGWPSSRGLSKKRRVLGECWDAKVSSAKVPEIFVSPLLEDSVDAAAVVVHELIHAVYPNAGHKGAFRVGMKAVGLEGKPTATVPGKDLVEFLKKIIAEIGDYPHAKISPEQIEKRKQTTRMKKLYCPANTTHAEDYILRGTRKQIDDVGLPTCPCGLALMEEEQDDDSE